MRSADRVLCAPALGAMALLVAGCAALPWTTAEPDPALVAAATAEPAASAAAGSTGAPQQASAPAARQAAAANPEPGRPAAAPAAASAPAAAPAVAAEPPAAAPPPPPEPRLPPVDSGTQAAFDEAVRALRAGRLSEAQQALRQLAQQHPELAGVHANLGLVKRRLGQLEESAAELQEAVRLSPRRAAFHNQLGITWRALGRFDRARVAYETAIELDPADAGALINLAILYDVYLGEPGRAAELYTRGAALLPAEAATINKWLVELKNRKAEPKLAATAATPRREKE